MHEHSSVCTYCSCLSIFASVRTNTPVPVVCLDVSLFNLGSLMCECLAALTVHHSVASKHASIIHVEWPFFNVNTSGFLGCLEGVAMTEWRSWKKEDDKEEEEGGERGRERGCSECENRRRWFWFIESLHQLTLANICLRLVSRGVITHTTLLVLSLVMLCSEMDNLCLYSTSLWGQCGFYCLWQPCCLQFSSKTHYVLWFSNIEHLRHLRFRKKKEKKTLPVSPQI